MRIIPSLVLAGLLGAVVVAPVAAADAAAGEARFKQLCSACHGPTGRGDGPAAAGLKPKPRSFADAQWQASVNDEHLRTVISKGGPAVGLAPTMTAWGHALKGDQLEDVIAFIRAQK
jgi:mono/diheme cytochrome c family protein